MISSYGTNLVVPAMPVAIQHNRLFFGLFASAANEQFHYSKYFSMLVFGPDPVKTFAQGYFELAMAQNPKPKTLGIVGADAEFQRKATDSARDNGKAAGLQIVYDRAYPPNTVDFSPIIARSRRLSRTWSMSRPIRRTRSASCARCRSSASRPTCWAAASPGSRRRRSRCSSARWQTAS